MITNIEMIKTLKKQTTDLTLSLRLSVFDFKQLLFRSKMKICQVKQILIVVLL